MSKIRLLSRTAIKLILVGLVLLPSPVVAQESKNLKVLNYETGWTHDGAGYHPAVFLLLENVSGRDLSSTTIKFHAKFTDMETLEVTVGRKNMRRTFKQNQKLPIAIIGKQSTNGLDGFELPFEVSYWPKLESKVTCRIGDTGDEIAETILIAKLDPETRAEDQSFEHLNQTATYNEATQLHNRPVASQPKSRTPEQRIRPEKTTMAAERYGAPSAVRTTTTTTMQAAKPTDGGGRTLLNSKPLPGLGEDFFNFEKTFDKPAFVDARSPDWAWAKYMHAGSGTEVLAGSKDRTGKVDVVILKIPQSQGLDPISLIASAKQLTGKYKSQTPQTPTRSVRYVGTARLEIASSTSPAYKAMCISGVEPDSTYLIVSRLNQDTEALLIGLSKKSSLLKQFQLLDNKESN